MKCDKELIKFILVLVVIFVLLISISCYLDYEELKYIPKEFRQYGTKR